MVSCLMGDSTALASAIVRCCLKSHDYRHTVATNFYEHGVSIQSIRDYLGHTFEEMTMQYIDYMPRKIAKENDAYFEEEENSLLACMQKGEKHG